MHIFTLKFNLKINLTKEFLTTMNDKQILARNLIRYRKQAKLTQAELAEKLNYSDKNISKWERADSMPDILVLRTLANFYGITMEDFFVEIKENSEEEIIIKKSQLTKKNKIFITTLSAILVWFICTCIFVLIHLLPINPDRAWLCFVYAIPVTAIVLTVFSSMWGTHTTSALAVSLLSWSLVLSFFLTFKLQDLWMLFLICIPMQILIILWYIYRKYKKLNFIFFKIEKKEKIKKSKDQENN